MSAPSTNMTRLTEEQRRHVLLQEFLALQEEQERKGAMPAARTVLSRFHWLFELMGALSVGLLCAAFTVLAVFMLTRVMFHVDMTRYLPHFLL